MVNPVYFVAPVLAFIFIKQVIVIFSCPLVKFPLVLKLLCFSALVAAQLMIADLAFHNPEKEDGGMDSRIVQGERRKNDEPDREWSFIPVSSIVFAWAITFPGITLGKRGIIVSFISFSAFIVPYLFLLGSLLKEKEVFSIGAVTAAAFIVFLWIIVAVFKRMERKLAALGTIFLTAIPFMILVNVILSNMSLLSL